MSIRNLRYQSKTQSASMSLTPTRIRPPQDYDPNHKMLFKLFMCGTQQDWNRNLHASLASFELLLLNLYWHSIVLGADYRCWIRTSNGTYKACSWQEVCPLHVVTLQLPVLNLLSSRSFYPCSSQKFAKNPDVYRVGTLHSHITWRDFALPLQLRPVPMSIAWESMHCHQKWECR